MASRSTRSKLTVAYAQVPSVKDLDFTRVRTVAEHDILILLGGAPLFSSGEHLEKIYCSKYSANRDSSTWTITFSEKAKFSDGSRLTAAHWYESLARAVRMGSGVHFNPKRELVGGATSSSGYCEGLQLKGNSVILRLNQPNKLFYRMLGRVESTVLPIHDPKAFLFDFFQSPSSGPYRVREQTTSHLLLEINPNYPGHKERAQFPLIEITQMDDASAVKSRIDGSVDFIFPMSVQNLATQKKLRSKSRVFRDFGQTMFLAFRPHTNTEYRPWHTDNSLRSALSALLRRCPKFEGYKKTTSILSGEGLGRIGKTPALMSRATKKVMPSLTVAAVNRPAVVHVLEYLKRSGLDVSWHLVDGFNDLYSDPKALVCDAILGWNDFSAPDPYISLYNAVNPDRPLFADPDGTFRARLIAAQAAKTSSAKSAAYRSLQIDILKGGLVIPIYKYWFDAYAAKNLDLRSLVGGALWTLKANK